MKALIIACHGSNKIEANDQMRKLTQQIRAFPTNPYEAVSVGFLEFARPSIGNAIDECVKSGAKSITVIPYFLSAGKHVKQDIPYLVSMSRKKYPNIPIMLTSHFGLHSELARLIVDQTLLETQDK